MAPSSHIIKMSSLRASLVAGAGRREKKTDTSLLCRAAWRGGWHTARTGRPAGETPTPALPGQGQPCRGVWMGVPCQWSRAPSGSWRHPPAPHPSTARRPFPWLQGLPRRDQEAVSLRCVEALSTCCQTFASWGAKITRKGKELGVNH